MREEVLLLRCISNSASQAGSVGVPINVKLCKGFLVEVRGVYPDGTTHP